MEFNSEVILADVICEYNMTSGKETQNIQPEIEIDVPIYINKTFTKKEIQNYIRQQHKSVFKNPIDEYSWAKTQNKICSKCKKSKLLCNFSGNTSGTDAFDKSGYRLRRPECSDCGKIVSKGKNEAKKRANQLGISYIAPFGTRCGVCNKKPTSGNGLVFDHCHTKNVFRGYCCNSCNRSIGVLGDDVDGILKVLNYLLKTENYDIVKNENGDFVKNILVL